MQQYHKVEQGDCLSSIAAKYGFADYKIIWNDAKNNALKMKRKNPNILLPGDIVIIPDKQEKNLSRGTSSTHTFQISQAQVMLRLYVKDDRGNVYANRRYEIAYAQRVCQGTTKPDGLIEQRIAPTVDEVSLKVWLGEKPTDGILSWNISLGNLDPFDTVTGVQGRLRNLGYNCGPVDGIVGQRTQTALKAFQSKAGLTVNGQLDAATCQKLREAHDGS